MTLPARNRSTGTTFGPRCCEILLARRGGVWQGGIVSTIIIR